MKKIRNLKLIQLSQTDLGKREMNALRGGGVCCLCGCNYANYGGSTTSGNGNANNAGGYHSPNSGGWGNGSSS